MLTNTYEKEIVQGSHLPAQAPRGQEHIYVLFLNDESGLCRKVPYYVGKAVNYASRLSRHEQIQWHNLIMRQPTQAAIVATVDANDVLTAEQELINIYTEAGILLLNRDIRDAETSKIQAASTLPLATKDELLAWIQSAPLSQSVLDDWILKWDLNRPGRSLSEPWNFPENHLTIIPDYPSQSGARLAWALLGLMEADRSSVNIPLDDLLEDSGLYWWELVEAMDSLLQSDMWDCTEDESQILTFRFTMPHSSAVLVRDYTYRHGRQQTTWTEFIGCVRELHQRFTGLPVKELPTLVELRHPEIDPATDSRYYDKKCILALCLSDGEHVGHPYYFLKTTPSGELYKTDYKYVDWHKQKFGVDPAIRIIYLPSDDSLAVPEHFAEEAWAAGYFLLEPDVSVGRYTGLVASDGRQIERILDHTEYFWSQLSMYKKLHLTDAFPWSRTPMSDRSTTGVPYSPNELELNHLNYLAESRRILAERELAQQAAKAARSVPHIKVDGNYIRVPALPARRPESHVPATLPVVPRTGKGILVPTYTKAGKAILVPSYPQSEYDNSEWADL